MSVRYICTLVIALLAIAVFEAPAQTTRPASAEWSVAVQSLAEALSGGDSATVRTMLGSDGTVRPFFGSDGYGLATLLEQSELACVISSRAYRLPSATLAADLAEDFRNSPLVRDEQKVQMIPADQIGYQRAETTGSQWIKRTIGAEHGDQVGLIVLWVYDKNGDLRPFAEGGRCLP